MFVYEFLKNTTLRQLQKLLVKSTRRAYKPQPQALLYVAANCLPYHINGYTLRTHAILTELVAKDVKVRAVTQSGYPWNRQPTLVSPKPLSTEHQGITYHHSKHPRKLLSLISYVQKAADYIEEHARAHGASCIHAASNYVNALPALVAARRLGIHFQYEMRGLWELSRKAQNPLYAHSYGYYSGICFEKFVAENAKRLFCISEALAHFVGLQIKHKKVFLLPNCVDAERIFPCAKQEVVAGHIGYAGSLVNYEGLDTLLHALKKLLHTNNNAFLHIVGDGKAQKSLENLAQELQLQDNVHFYGKLSPEAARQRLEQCALVCISRTPMDVCKIVPPIKLVEAMALAKSVVVPNLPVFQEEASSVPAFLFDAGNSTHLAEVLGTALSDTHSLIQRGQACRDYVLNHRQWKHFIDNIVPQEDN